MSGGEIVVGDVDSVCARGQLELVEADGRALCALSIRVPQYLTAAAYFTLYWRAYFTAHFAPPARHKVSPGWKACAGLGLADALLPTNPAAAAAAAGRQTGRAIPAHCVTADASITPAYHILAPTPCSNVQKCDICRSLPWGHINPSSSRGQVVFGHLKTPILYVAISLWSFEASLLYVAIKSSMSHSLSILTQQTAEL